MNADGRFACVVYPGDSADAKEHRRRIFALCGDRQAKPLVVRPAAGKTALGSALETHSTLAPLKTDLLGRLGQLFETHLEQHQEIEDVLPARELSDSERGVLTVLKPPVRPNRPLAERELLLLRHAGMENDELAITALNLFNATIVG